MASLNNLESEIFDNIVEGLLAATNAINTFSDSLSILPKMIQDNVTVTSFIGYDVSRDNSETTVTTNREGLTAFFNSQYTITTSPPEGYAIYQLGQIIEHYGTVYVVAETCMSREENLDNVSHKAHGGYVNISTRIGDRFKSSEVVGFGFMECQSRAGINRSFDEASPDVELEKMEINLKEIAPGGLMS